MQNDNYNDYSPTRVCVVGGGAAGMMAAGTALLYGADVTVYESQNMLGKKLGQGIGTVIVAEYLSISSKHNISGRIVCGISIPARVIPLIILLCTSYGCLGIF